MLVHCLSVRGLCADSGILALTCARCGMQTAFPLEHLTEKFGADCTVGDVVGHARCRECGGWLVASPEWGDDD